MKKMLLIPAALLALTLAACSETEKKDNMTGDPDTAVLKPTGEPTAADLAANAGEAWNDVDFNSPDVKYDEITDQAVEVQGNDRYGIYSLGEDILFTTGSAEITSKAQGHLKQIAASINQRYKDANVRIMGFADATGSADANQDLSQKRAEAVRAYLGTAGLAADKVTVRGMGETAPVASNSTESGKQQNRRVQIVARKS